MDHFFEPTLFALDIVQPCSAQRHCWSLTTWPENCFRDNPAAFKVGPSLVLEGYQNIVFYWDNTLLMTYTIYVHMNLEINTLKTYVSIDYAK